MPLRTDNPLFDFVRNQSPNPTTNFEKRMYNTTNKMQNEDGSFSTHKMMSWSDDNGFYVAPTIIEKDGQLVELTEDEAIDYAYKTGELKQFKSEQEAQEYASNGYKKGTPMEMFSPNEEYRGFENGGEYKTKLSEEDEVKFQSFYNTLPENLKTDDDTYDIRGYWDALDRIESFDYNQPKEEDGYYHAFSRHPKTGMYLKSPSHPTFKMGIEEDKKQGYNPIIRPDGRVYTINPMELEDGGEMGDGQIKTLPPININYEMIAEFQRIMNETKQVIEKEKENTQVEDAKSKLIERQNAINFIKELKLNYSTFKPQ